MHAPRSGWAAASAPHDWESTPPAQLASGVVQLDAPQHVATCPAHAWAMQAPQRVSSPEKWHAGVRCVASSSTKKMQPPAAKATQTATTMDGTWRTAHAVWSIPRDCAKGGAVGVRPNVAQALRGNSGSPRIGSGGTDRALPDAVMRAPRPLAVLVQLVALAACGGSTSTVAPPDGGSNAGPDASGEAGSDAGGDAPTVDASSFDAPSADAPSADAPSVDGASDGGCPGIAPPLCFGSSSQGCCGQDPAGQATCVAGAWMCGAAPAPGCDGTSCGHPPADASTGLACGPYTCDRATQYCLEGVGGIQGTTYACNSVPPMCQGNPTCGCIAMTGCTCSDQGGITVQCPVG
jgi:hypothetical protein